MYIYIYIWYYIPLVNAISLEPFHQSTSNLKYDTRPPEIRMLLILGPLPKKQDDRHQTFKIYVLLKVIYACERVMFETIFPIDYKLENCFHII